MAQLVGDGPNRGRSAPPPPRLPRPREDDAPRTSERRGGPQRSTQPKPEPPPNGLYWERRPPVRFNWGYLGPLFGRDENGVRNSEKFKIDLGVDKKPEFELAPEQQDYDTVMADVWGNLENEGASGAVKRESGALALAPAEERAQMIQNVADAYDVKARLGRRDQARIDREANDRIEKDKVLTAQEWARLSPLQQAAVQANADLAEAVAADFRDQSKHDSNQEGDDSQFRRHEDRVKELFGDEGRLGFKGLQYAPNTLAFLEKRGIDKAGLGGHTLDDLISGDALFDGDTVKALATEQPQRGLAPADPRYKNIEFAKHLAAGQLQYQEEVARTLAAGKQLLSGMTSTGTNPTANQEFGAKAEEPMTRLTAVRPETLQQLDKYMEALARPDLDPAETMSMIEKDLAERGAGQQELDQVYQAMRERVRVGMDGSGQWFPDVEYQLRTPDEVAQALGLPTLKRRGEM